MLVGARDHQHVVSGHPHVAAEDVGGHTETGHVADVARAVGVRPGDGGQDMSHGVILGVSRYRVSRWPDGATFGGMDTLLAEDLLLLLLDSDKGTWSSTAPIPTVLGGAVLADLALREYVIVGEKTSVWKKAKVLPDARVSPPPIPSSARRWSWSRRRSAPRRTWSTGWARASRNGWPTAWSSARSSSDGTPRCSACSRAPRWPEADASHEREVRQALTAVLVQGVEPDPRTGTLVALLSAIDRPHKAVDHDGIPSRESRSGPRRSPRASGRRRRSRTPSPPRPPPSSRSWPPPARSAPAADLSYR